MACNATFFENDRENTHFGNTAVPQGWAGSPENCQQITTQIPNTFSRTSCQACIYYDDVNATTAPHPQTPYSICNLNCLYLHHLHDTHQFRESKSPNKLLQTASTDIPYIGNHHIPNTHSIHPSLHTTFKTIDKLDDLLSQKQCTIKQLESIYGSIRYLTQHTHPGITNLHCLAQRLPRSDLFV